MTDHKGYVKMARVQGVHVKPRDEQGNAIMTAPSHLARNSDSDKAIVGAINNAFFAATASRDESGNIDRKQTNQNRVIEKEDYFFDETGMLRCIRHTDQKLYQSKRENAYIITPEGTCNCKLFMNTGVECKHLHWAKIYFPTYFTVKKQFIVITDQDISDI